MTFSGFFHPECDPVESDDALNHVVFSCLQWKKPNLEAMSQADKQRFAVMYGDEMMIQFVIAALERAYVLGAMSPVRLIAVHEDQLYLFGWWSIKCYVPRNSVDAAGCRAYESHSA